MKQGRNCKKTLVRKDKLIIVTFPEGSPPGERAHPRSDSMPGGKPSHEQADPKGDPITRGSSYTKSEAPQRSQPHQHIPGATPIPGLGPSQEAAHPDRYPTPGTTPSQKAAHLKSDPLRSQPHQHIPGATRSEPSPGATPSQKPARDVLGRGDGRHPPPLLGPWLPSLQQYFYLKSVVFL